jgi:phage terminase large subunit-like protein
MSEPNSGASWPSSEQDPVTRYAHEIVNWVQPAGKWHRLACERHLHDLAASARGEFPYRWRVDLGKKGIGLFRLFRHHKGEWGGKPIILDPWECFIVGSILGWVHVDTGLRRFRNAFVEVPRGSGKAEWVENEVPTPNGFKRIADLHVGDMVFDELGEPTRIVAVTDPMVGHDCYAVSFATGEDIVVAGDHLWTVNRRAEPVSLRRRWTPEEDDTIRAVYASSGANGLQEALPHRSRYALYARSKSIGVGRGGRHARAVFRLEQPRQYGQDDPSPTIDTRTLASSFRLPGSHESRYSVDVASALQLPAADLPIQPYTLGAWLGDGHSASARLTIHVNDAQILQGIRDEGIATVAREARPGILRVTLGQLRWRGGYRADVCRRGHLRADHENRSRHCLHCERLRYRAARNATAAPPLIELSLHERLRHAGLLNNKHIPEVYFRAGYDQRLTLLRGLMDTDGTASKIGQCSFTSVSHRLAMDVAHLMRTLGLKPSVQSKTARCRGKDCGTAWTISVFPPADMSIFALDRKRARQRPILDTRTRRRSVVDVRPVPSVPVKCIQVENPSGLYLTSRSYIPTHNSTLAAGILIIFTFFDGEPGAEGYCFATKKDQARIVFKTARQMVLRSSVVREFVQVLRHNLHNEETESKLEALGANEDTLDGLRPHVAVGDEIHKHGSPDLVEVVESGMGTRREPLLFNITTAGESEGTETIYGQQLSISTQVLEGFDKGFDIPEWFAFIAAADPDDDWTQESTWIKANPAWNISVKPDFLRKELAKALANPAEQPKFRRLYLGQKVQAIDAFFSLEDWDACPPLPDDEELRKFPSWLGLDLSSRVDVSAMVQVWRLGPEEIAIRPTFWLPADDIEERRRRDKVPYPQWAAANHLRLTPGNTIDRSASSPIRAALGEAGKAWKVKSICFDPWQAGDMTQALQDDDKLLLMPIGQSFKMLSQPTKDLQAMVLARRVRHDRNPVMRWMMSNAKKREDDKGNVMLCKRRSRGRIDGPAALVDAVNQALLKVENKVSRYQTGGAFIIGSGGVVDGLTGKEIGS